MKAKTSVFLALGILFVVTTPAMAAVSVNIDESIESNNYVITDPQIIDSNSAASDNSSTADTLDNSDLGFEDTWRSWALLVLILVLFVTVSIKWGSSSR